MIRAWRAWAALSAADRERLCDADFAHPREPMTLGGALMLLAVLAAGASVAIGLIAWVVEELSR